MIPRKGKGEKGQKWNGETGVWEYPEGYVPPVKSESTHVETKEEGTISAGDVAEIVNAALAKQRDELLSTMSEKIRVETPVYKGDTERHLALERAAIDDADQLETPVCFFAWNRMIYLDSYMDRGREKNPPYNKPIVFSPMPPLVDTDEKGERKELQRCMVEIWSRAQVKFLEEHPAFAAGMIMKDARDLNRDDIKHIHLKNTVIATVARMAQSEVINACKGRQMTGLSNDFVTMRNRLIDSMCKEIMTSNEARREKMARESKNAELLYGK